MQASKRCIRLRRARVDGIFHKTAAFITVAVAAVATGGASVAVAVVAVGTQKIV